MAAILKRELNAYFSSPIGWVFLGVFFLFSGYFFWYILAYNVADISVIFENMFMFYMFLIPVLTMRLLSEDKRLKTDQLLFTSPVSLTGVILGKFFAAWVVFALALSINVAYALILSVYVTFSWVILLGNLLGALLLGAALIGVGLLISSLTENQLVSAVAAFAVSLILYLLDNFKGSDANAFLYKALDAISLNAHYAPFTKGLVSYANVFFFAGVAAIFVFLTIRLQDRKRWS